MKNFLKVFLVLAFLGVVSPVYAQTDESVQDQKPVIVDVEGLRAEFIQETQDPASKDATFKMVLDSNLNSDRVKISWTLTTLEGNGAVFKDKTKVVSYMTIAKGQTYTIPITITPVGKGEFELLGKAESFKAGEAFTVTAKKVMKTNATKEILPLSDDYKSKRMLNAVKDLVLVVAIIAGSIFLAVKGFKWFRKWLKK